MNGEGGGTKCAPLDCRSATGPGELQTRGLVHFSAERRRNGLGLLPENMDLSPLRVTLQFSCHWSNCLLTPHIETCTLSFMRCSLYTSLPLPVAACKRDRPSCGLSQENCKVGDWSIFRLKDGAMALDC